MGGTEENSINEVTSVCTITVYHGSISLFDMIDVKQGKPYKDFGRGFYVTKSDTHAKNIALRNKRIERERYGKLCDAYLYTYNMDMGRLQEFKVKEFPVADLEWVQFVLANRKVRNRTHDYDVVIGPTANDDTMVVLNAYLDGLYGVVGSDEALKVMLRNIEAEKLPGQIFFAGNDATVLLAQKGQVEKL